MIIIISYRLPLRIFKPQFIFFFLAIWVTFEFLCSARCELNIQIIIALLSLALCFSLQKENFIVQLLKSLLDEEKKNNNNAYEKQQKALFFFVCARCRVKHVRERFNKQYRCFCLFLSHLEYSKKKKNKWTERERAKKAKKWIFKRRKKFSFIPRIIFSRRVLAEVFFCVHG